MINQQQNNYKRNGLFCLLILCAIAGMALHWISPSSIFLSSAYSQEDDAPSDEVKDEPEADEVKHPEFWVLIDAVMVKLRQNQEKQAWGFHNQAFDYAKETEQGLEAVAYVNSGDIHSHFGNYTEAQKHYFLAYKMAKKFVEDDDREDYIDDNIYYLALSLSRLGEAEMKINRYDQAKMSLDASLMFLPHVAYELYRPEIWRLLANTYASLAKTEYQLDDEEKARKNFTNAVDIYYFIITKHDSPQAQLDLATISYDYGEFEDKVANTNQALRLYQQAVRIYEEYLEAFDHPAVLRKIATTNRVIGDLYIYRGEFETAKEHFEIGLKQLKSVIGNEKTPQDYYDLVMNYQRLTSISSILKDYEVAQGYLDIANEMVGNIDISERQAFKENLIIMQQMIDDKYDVDAPK